MSISMSTVTVDCANAADLARFWADALGWAVAPGASAEVAAVGGPDRPRDTPSLLFVQVPEPKTLKNRWHLDLTAADPDREVERLVGLGAIEVHRKQEWGASWVTLRDPEGNEFCVALPHQVPETAEATQPTEG